MEKSEGITIPHEKPWRYEEGEYTVTRGSAWSGPGCHLGCGVLMYTDKDGKLVKVEGDPENPMTEGRLCVRCLDMPEIVNHKDRLTYPMKRARADRGKNKWERVSWDEAYDIVEREFNAIKDEYGAESVVFIHGTGRDIAPWQSRLCWSFGSPNYGNVLSGNACYLPRVAGMAATTGSFWIADVAQHVPRPVRPRGLDHARSHVRVGQQPPHRELGRLLRPLGHRPHEARHEDRGHRPARDVPGGEGEPAPAHPPRHRRGAGARHVERHHQRGNLR